MPIHTPQDRLAFGVPEDHTALVKLGADLIHRPRAKLLFQRGFKTVDDLVVVGPAELARVLSDSRPYGDEQLGARAIRRLTEAIITRAKRLLLLKESGGATPAATVTAGQPPL